MSWFAYAEHIEQLREAVRLLQCDVSRCRATVDAPTRWPRKPPFSGRISNRLGDLLADVETLGWLLDFILESSDPTKFGEGGLLPPLLATYRQELRNHSRNYSVLNDIVNQRFPQEDTPDWHAFLDQQRDLRGCGMLHRAADAVTLDYWIQIYGERWVASKLAWPPLTLFTARRGYGVDVRNSVVFIPNTDLYRARLWPHLAHEIAHTKIDLLFSPSPRHPGLCSQVAMLRNKSDIDSWPPHLRTLAIDLFGDNASAVVASVSVAYGELLEAVRSVHRRILADASQVSGVADADHRQVSELLADAVAVLAAGPPAIFAYLAVSVLDLVPIDSGEKPDPNAAERLAVDWAVRAAHPPDSVRVHLMAHVLDQQGLRSALPDRMLERYQLGYRYTFERAEYEPFAEALDTWEESRSSIYEASLKVASLLLRGVAFSPSDLEMAEIGFATPPAQWPQRPFLPRHVMSMCWLKRLKAWERVRDAGKTLAEDGLMAFVQGPSAGLFGSMVHRLVRMDDEMVRKVSVMQNSGG